MPKWNVRAYYQITKPGIIKGNLITALAAYLYGAQSNLDFSILLCLCVGTSFIIACGCVLNNIFDIDIDKLMSRTSKRELVLNLISKKTAYIYAAVLGVIGIVVLVYGTNALTLTSGIIGLIFYAGIYTYSKRRTYHSTLIGTIPGAMPPVAGYLAATNSLDIVCLILFLILVFWQMPHFLAIAIRRIDDYRAADLPVMPLVKGLAVTNMFIRLYILGFALSCLTLFLIGRAGLMYVVAMLSVSSIWAYITRTKNNQDTELIRSKRIFLFSLIMLLLFDLLIVVDRFVS